LQLLMEVGWFGHVQSFQITQVQRLARAAAEISKSERYYTVRLTMASSGSATTASTSGDGRDESLFSVEVGTWDDDRIDERADEDDVDSGSAKGSNSDDGVLGDSSPSVGGSSVLGPWRSDILKWSVNKMRVERGTDGEGG
jgi:hypothetical protein